VAQQVEGAVARNDGEPSVGTIGNALEGPRRQRPQERVLDGVLGDLDTARAKPSRQRRNQPIGRITGERGDEVVDRFQPPLVPYPAAFA
jgi:hypothetical protein